MKVLLILVDGMRPDSLENIPFVENLKKKSAHTLCATTVHPSDTLPCHMSLFYGVEPQRHGTLTNTYAPQTQPMEGLFELLHKQKKRTAMFYSWQQLRDVARPGSLDHAYFINCNSHPGEEYVSACVDAAESYIKTHETDFAFLYLAFPDAAGHAQGWMSQAYLDSVKLCWEYIEKILKDLPEDYAVIITADHGGHDRTHGTLDRQDMEIPMFLLGKDFTPGQILQNVSIKDIAPTVAELLGVLPDSAWEGKSLL